MSCTNFIGSDRIRSIIVGQYPPPLPPFSPTSVFHKRRIQNSRVSPPEILIGGTTQEDRLSRSGEALRFLPFLVRFSKFSVWTLVPIASCLFKSPPLAISKDLQGTARRRLKHTVQPLASSAVYYRKQILKSHCTSSFLKINWAPSRRLSIYKPTLQFLKM